MKKIAILLIFIITLLPTINVFAEEVANNLDNEAAPVENNNNANNDVAEEPNLDSANNVPNEDAENPSAADPEPKPEPKKLFQINEENLPGSAIRMLALNYDNNGDGWIDEEENASITSFSYNYTQDNEGVIDIRGIEKLNNISLIYLYSNIENSVTFKGLKELESLKSLNSISFGKIKVPREFKSLSLKSLENVAADTEVKISDFTNLNNLINLEIKSSLDDNLSGINSLPKLESLLIKEANNIKSLELASDNTTLRNLVLRNSILKELKGIESYKNLEGIEIAKGFIYDLSNLNLLDREKLNYVHIHDQLIRSNKRFIVGQPFKVDDVKFPVEVSGSKVTKEFFSADSIVDEDNITWNEKSFKNYDFSYSQYIESTEDNLATKNLSYSGRVYDISPIDYEDGEWLKGYVGTILAETFIKDKKPINVFRQFNSTSIKDSLFSNTFLVDGKSYTYSYSNGNDSTSLLYFKNNDSEISNSINPENTELFVKKEDGKYYLKTKSFYRINDKLLQKEETSYVKDDGIVHDVTYTNLSEEPMSNIKIAQMLDTMLNEDDAVPIYADGRGNAYIVAPTFALYLEKLGEKGNIISGKYAVGPESDTAKEAKDYEKGYTLLEGYDTAIYYSTGLFSLEPNQSFTYSYKETIYTEIPKIKAEDKTINVNDPWDPLDQLIGIFNGNEEELDKSKVEITHNVDTSIPGVYYITYTYNNIYSKTVKLTVLPKDSKEVKIKKVTVPNTGDKNSVYLYSVMLMVALISVGLLIRTRKEK